MKTAVPQRCVFMPSADAALSVFICFAIAGFLWNPGTCLKFLWLDAGIYGIGELSLGKSPSAAFTAGGVNETSRFMTQKCLLLTINTAKDEMESCALDLAKGRLDEPSCYFPLWMRAKGELKGSTIHRKGPSSRVSANRTCWSPCASQLPFSLTVFYP